MERFYQKIAKEQTGCWHWQAYRNANGYGEFRFNGRAQLAHRVSWTIVHGAIPDGVFVLHRCDNPRCVNPDHLFLGTQRDNMRDAMAKGRMRGLRKPGDPSNKPYGFTRVVCAGCGAGFDKRHCRIRQCPTHYCTAACFRRNRPRRA